MIQHLLLYQMKNDKIFETETQCMTHDIIKSNSGS